MKVSKLAFLPLLAAAIAGCSRPDAGGDARPAGDAAALAATPITPVAAPPVLKVRAPRPGARTVAVPKEAPEATVTAPATGVAVVATGVVAVEAGQVAAIDVDAGEDRSAGDAAAAAPVLTTTSAAGPAPVVLGTSASDRALAYADAARRTYPDTTELGGGDLDGLVLAPGLYRWSTGVTIPGEVTLAGGADDVWIFQIAQDLVLQADAKVALSGGARARNVFWQVAGRTSLGRAAVVVGTILSRPPSTPETGPMPGGVAPAPVAALSQASASRIP